MTAYYNEIDPYAAQWLRNLIAAGHIAPGDVDERSIEDVHPDDLRGYTQCHFFAGIGVWSYAIRRAGWPDDRPVWTGSCPCQPFSAAGKGAGFDDERHLWPAWHHLIKERRPAAIFGEQVASKAVDAWIDLVHADLEAVDFAFASVPFPSASVGAPHIRDRNFWMAYADQQQWNRSGKTGTRRRLESAIVGPVGGLDNTISHGRRTGRDDDSGNVGLVTDATINNGRLAHSDGRNARAKRIQRICEHGWIPEDSSALRSTDKGIGRGHIDTYAAGPVNGFWSDADWLLCRDGEWRPVEPGTFPLAHGATSRVGRLRAYGNAINAQAAEAFIRAAM